MLLTGIPSGIIPGFQNFTGTTQADLLRLNLAIPPSSAPNNLGLLGGDLAGFPNGRRVADDVVTIEVRAMAGATYTLVDSTFKPDDTIPTLTQGLTSSDTDQTAKGTEHYLNKFPYLGHPHSGFEVPAACVTTITTRRCRPAVRARWCSTSATGWARSSCSRRPELNGVEIELTNQGEEAAAFVHTEVRERRLPDGSVYAGVVPELRLPGEYVLVDHDRRPVRPVTIATGRVTEVDW